MNEPDIDIGHVDDEPDMLQNTAYETTQYAAKLLKETKQKMHSLTFSAF